MTQSMVAVRAVQIHQDNWKPGCPVSIIPANDQEENSVVRHSCPQGDGQFHFLFLKYLQLPINSKSNHLFPHISSILSLLLSSLICAHTHRYSFSFTPFSPYRANELPDCIYSASRKSAVLKLDQK